MKLSDFENSDGTMNVKFVKKFYKDFRDFLLSKTADKETRKEINSKFKELMDWDKLKN